VIYNAVFVMISAATTRAIAVGLLYVLVWEILMANFVSGVRLLSVSHYGLRIANGFINDSLLQAGLSAGRDSRCPRGAAAEFRGHELDREGRHPVIDAAGQRQRERPQVPVPGGHGQATSRYHDESDRYRHQHADADVGVTARRPPDDQESGHAGRGGADAAEDGRVPPPRPGGQHVGVPRHGPDDQDREDQVADQEWLDQREARSSRGCERAARDDAGDADAG
jgi:hypothetical protein